jgi:phosphoribosyl-dephospho-CoA transferase
MITLTDILKAREERVRFRETSLNEGITCVSVQMNIPGNLKQSYLYKNVFMAI